MYTKSKIKNSYYDLKKVFKETKKESKKLDIKNEEKFEDVSKELSDKDREGSFKYASYMDFYMGVKFEQDKTIGVQPSGMTAKNANYDYPTAKSLGN
tara:strand:- start:247 stop:537 length:291 start_codon:yes stop_codon:yes gene_type:complete